MPRVSVLLTTYNRPEMLLKAANSVFKQTYQDFELIILDDNSNDAYQIVTLQDLIKDPRVVYFKSNTKKEERKLATRYATMVNNGLKLARGEFISYLCDDDYYMPDRLEKMVAYFDANPDAMVVNGSQKVVQLVNGLEIPYAGEIRKSIPLQSDASCQVDHSSVMMRKSLIEQVEYWDDDPAWWGSADAVYWKKINTAGFPFHGLPDVLDVHVYHDGSWTKDGRWETEL